MNKLLGEVWVATFWYFSFRRVYQTETNFRRSPDSTLPFKKQQNNFKVKVPILKNILWKLNHSSWGLPHEHSLLHQTCTLRRNWRVCSASLVWLFSLVEIWSNSL